MTERVTARQVLMALEKRPDLYWEVANAIRDRDDRHLLSRWKCRKVAKVGGTREVWVRELIFSYSRPKGVAVSVWGAEVRGYVIELDEGKELGARTLGDAHRLADKTLTLRGRHIIPESKWEGSS
jgi:hypothetical protein